MASVAWLSVTAKRGVKLVVPPVVLKCNWDDSFGELLHKAASHLQTSTVLAKNDLFMNSQVLMLQCHCVSNFNLLHATLQWHFGLISKCVLSLWYLPGVPC